MRALPLDKIRGDFDRIARLLSEQPERSDLYEAFLLSQIPPDCDRVLEVGCGVGRLARSIAEHGATVTALDASPEMIRIARERATGHRRLRFLCDDFLGHAFHQESFDCVLSVATLHHLDAGVGLAKMRGLLRPGGVLVIQDLWSPASLGDWLRSGLAALATGDGWTWIRSRAGAGDELRDAWRDHGVGERYLTRAALQSLCVAHLPGAKVYVHPLWRYTAVWTRPRE